MPIQNPIALYELDATKLALTGSVVWFAGLSVPDGWLIANGAELSRTVYAELFAAIGTAHGNGDGSTTFNLPDLRGEFIRGFDNGRGVDAGRLFASAQTDAFQEHWHEHYAQAQNVDVTGGTDNAPNQRAAFDWDTPMVDGSGRTPTRNTIAAPGFGTPRTASETRPRNVALLGLIKY
jgi:microcystin-dependent protein